MAARANRGAGTPEATRGRLRAGPTVWLCRPGVAADPCTADLTTTVEQANGATSVQHPAPARSSRFDCFYVYPTVSLQKAANADLRVQPSEMAAARSQASPFSQVCRVWAPMYRQVTLAELSRFPDLDVPRAATAVAYDSLRSAFEDYLATDNHRRPIVFLGHSQGAAMLILLLQRLVEGDPTLRHRLVMAVLLGGNVTVRSGRLAGGSFSDIPLCRSLGESGCVVAYSSFLGTPPADALFGRPGQGASLQTGQTARRGVQVACVNPAALSGGKVGLDPWFPTAGALSTPWVSYPGRYSARCEHRSGATWLQVDPASAADRRPAVSDLGGPQWGLHVDDVNLAMGNLVDDVRAAEAHWRG